MPTQPARRPRPASPASSASPTADADLKPVPRAQHAPRSRVTPSARLSPQEVAESVRDGMFPNDRATRALGVEILAIGPGSATASMAVRDDMLNGHDICHGGLITTLADSTFAFACNSYNELTVASGFAVDFLAPARLGDTLTARCVEVSRSGRTGVYDVEVVNQRGERVAVFRGRSYTVKGKPAVGA